MLNRLCQSELTIMRYNLGTDSGSIISRKILFEMNILTDKMSKMRTLSLASSLLIYRGTYSLPLL